MDRGTILYAIVVGWEAATDGEGMPADLADAAADDVVRKIEAAQGDA